MLPFVRTEKAKAFWRIFSIFKICLTDDISFFMLKPNASFGKNKKTNLPTKKLFSTN